MAASKRRRHLIFFDRLRNAWRNVRVWFDHVVIRLRYCQKPIHLIISGPSRSGTTLVYNMLRSSVDQSVVVPEKEMRALATTHMVQRRIITKRPLDLIETNKIVKRLHKMRTLKFLVLRRDPRDLVSSMHKSVPGQFFQGWDYQFFVPGGSSIQSLSNPGIVACCNSEKTMWLIDKIDVKVIKYEEILQDTDTFQTAMREWSTLPIVRNFREFYTADTPESLQRALNGLRPVAVPERPAWLSDFVRLERAARQVALFPELEAKAEEWGYIAFGTMLERFGMKWPQLEWPRGTIIAFHTPDALYTAEARRFQASVDRLGLRLDLKVVPSRGEWTANCALKPSIIADARRRLRGPLLYVDVDAVIHHDPWPYLAQYDGDAACHVTRDGEFLSGTLWVNDTEGARELLRRWRDRCETFPEVWDQKSLEAVVLEDERKSNSSIMFQRLPPNFSHIFDRKYGYFYGDVVIEHLQASRENRAGNGTNPSIERRRQYLAEWRASAVKTNA